MNSGLLAEISGFNKDKLAPTTTTVRYATAILGNCILQNEVSINPESRSSRRPKVWVRRRGAC